MSGSPEGAPQAKHDPLAALRQPKFALYTSSRFSASIANAMLQAILGWHIYDLTGSALSLGFLGLARFLPSLGMSMVGGATADAYNRRNIIMAAQTILLGCGALFAVATINGWITPELIYGLVLLVGLANAFENPARQALLPAIVRTETFANAVTVSTNFQSLGMVTGLVVGGTLAGLDPGVAYIAYSGCLVAAVSAMALLRYEQTDDGVKRSVSVAAIKEGVQFVWQRKAIFGAMSLDMFAVLFGGAKGLLPIYAQDILQVGGFGYGVLLASLEIGAVIMSFIMVVRPPVYRTGRVLIYSVAAFGLMTIVFGFSRNIYLSIAAYMMVGAADMVSMVMRNVIIQLSTPDHLRGRVSSVSQVFIQASNQLGAMESGFMAALTTATFAVVSGGVGAVAVAGAIAWRIRELFDYKTEAHDRSTHVLPPEREELDETAVASGG